MAEVRLETVVIGDEDVLAHDGTATRVVQRTQQVAAVVLAAEQVGIAQRCMDLTVDYLGQRVQFGRPLASFQALKHRCAQMMTAIELSRSAVLGAARAFDAQPDAPTLLRLAAMARCQADEAAQFCTCLLYTSTGACSSYLKEVAPPHKPLFDEVQPLQVGRNI